MKKQQPVGSSYLQEAIDGLKKHQTLYLEPFTYFIESCNRGYISEKSNTQQKEAINNQFDEIVMLMIDYDLYDPVNDEIVKGAREMFRNSIGDFDHHDADD